MVDKRITLCRLNCERLDTGVGVALEVVGAVVMMAACSFGLARTKALNGILLLSALVFLILLANGKPVLGPWTYNRAQNWIGGLVTWAVTIFSFAPLVTTYYPTSRCDSICTPWSSARSSG